MDVPTEQASTRSKGQRAIEREVDSALRLLSEIYLDTIRKYNGACVCGLKLDWFESQWVEESCCGLRVAVGCLQVLSATIELTATFSKLFLS